MATDSDTPDVRPAATASLTVPLAIAGFGVAAASFVAFVEPGGSNPAAMLYLSCPSRTLFGVLCPLCGGTRAVRSLVTGDWGSVLRNNALVPGIVFLAIWGWTVSLATAMGWSRWPRVPQRRGVWRTVVVLVIVYGILRNVPLPVFDALRPV